MDLKFFKCMSCGNIVIKLHDSKVPVVCCGEPMKELVAGATDGALEKHVPVVEVSGNSVKVTVGSVEHPMLDEHFIEFIVLKTNKGFSVKHLNPGDKPVATFALEEDEKVETAFEYCNLHGLWKS